jgi:periplasmic mercuric ion binding protein
MKKFAVLILILLLGGITSESFSQKNDRAEVYFQSDMDCADCEKVLFEHLKFEKGVKNLKVDHASNTIYIEYVGKKNDEKGLAGAIKEKGYKAEKIDRNTYDQILSEVKEKGHEHQQEVHKERR